MPGDRKVIVVNAIWATLFMALFAAAVCSSIGYAWNQGQVLAVLQSKVDNLERANVPSRIDKLEQKVEAVNQTTTRLESQADRLNDKIDLIIQNQAIGKVTRQ